MSRLVCLMVWSVAIGGCGQEGHGPGPGTDPSGNTDPDPAPDPVMDDDPSAIIYAQDHLPRFDLEIPPVSIALLEDEPREYAPATFRYGDIVLQNVGVKLKGDTTFRELDEKPSFKIKFDKFVEDQRFLGLRRMTLNSGVLDKASMVERLSYMVFRNANLPASRANNAEVHVNGELYGLYVNLETNDKVFLKRWFGSNEGNVYESWHGGPWEPGTEYDYELETNEELDDRSDLVALMAAVAEARDETLLEDMEHILDTERFLRYCAVEGMVNQKDGFAYSQYDFPNNFRLYHDPSVGQFSVLPWSMDWTMKEGSAYGQYIDMYKTTSNLLERCLGVESCRTEYERVLAEEADRFESLDLVARAAEIREQIIELLHRDTRKEHDIEEFDDHYEDVVFFLETRPDNIRQQIEDSRTGTPWNQDIRTR